MRRSYLEAFGGSPDGNQFLFIESMVKYQALSWVPGLHRCLRTVLEAWAYFVTVQTGNLKPHTG